MLGTTVSNVVMTLLLGRRLRRELGGLEVRATLRATALMIARRRRCSPPSPTASGTGSTTLLGRSLPAQLDLGRRRAARSAGSPTPRVVLRSGLPEARQIVDLFARRLGAPAS